MRMGVRLFSVLKTENELRSNRFSAFFQDTYTWRQEGAGLTSASARGYEPWPGT